MYEGVSEVIDRILGYGNRHVSTVAFRNTEPQEYDMKLEASGWKYAIFSRRGSDYLKVSI
jgi:hypothetical protein